MFDLQAWNVCKQQYPQESEAFERAEGQLKDFALGQLNDQQVDELFGRVQRLTWAGQLTRLEIMVLAMDLATQSARRVL